MKYLHTLDPDDLREMEDEYWKNVAELEAEDAFVAELRESIRLFGELSTDSRK